MPCRSTAQLGVTKIPSMKTTERSKRGPKPKPEEEKVKKTSISILHETYEGLLAIGDGVLSHGVEIAYKAVKLRASRKSGVAQSRPISRAKGVQK